MALYQLELITDARLTEDPGVASFISAWFHTFMEIEREIYLEKQLKDIKIILTI